MESLTDYLTFNTCTITKPPPQKKKRQVLSHIYVQLISKKQDKNSNQEIYNKVFSTKSL